MSAQLVGAEIEGSAGTVGKAFKMLDTVKNEGPEEGLKERMTHVSAEKASRDTVHIARAVAVARRRGREEERVSELGEPGLVEDAPAVGGEDPARKGTQIDARLRGGLGTEAEPSIPLNRSLSCAVDGCVRGQNIVADDNDSRRDAIERESACQSVAQRVAARRVIVAALGRAVDHVVAAIVTGYPPTADNTISNVISKRPVTCAQEVNDALTPRDRDRRVEGRHVALGVHPSGRDGVCPIAEITRLPA